MQTVNSNVWDLKAWHIFFNTPRRFDIIEEEGMLNNDDLMNKLEQHGFTKEQAKGSLKVWMEIMNDNFATKDDLKKHSILLRDELEKQSLVFHDDLEKHSLKLHNEMEKLSLKLHHDAEKLSINLHNNLEKVSKDITIKLGAMIVAAIGVFSALNKI